MRVHTSTRYVLVALLVLFVLHGARGESRCVDVGLRTARTGTIRTSPEGTSYMANEDCEWTIAPQPMAAGECVEFHLVEMDVDEDWDFFYVTGDDTHVALSGWYDDVTLPATSPSLHLHFTSDSDPWGEIGVVAEWRVVPCERPEEQQIECANTGVITARSGMLRALDASLPDDEPLPAGLDCAWTLQPALGEGECVVVELVRPVVYESVYNDFALWDLHAGGFVSRVYGAHFPPAASRDTLTVTLRTEPENTFLEQVPSLALDYRVEPCASVHHLLPLRDGEENVVALTAESGAIPVEALWRTGISYVINNTRLQDDDMCVRLHALTVGGVAPLRSGAQFSWLPSMVTLPTYTILGPVMLVDTSHVFADDYGAYEIVSCPGRTAQLRAAEDHCATFRAIFKDTPGFDSLQGNRLCCGHHTQSNSQLVFFSIQCKDFQVPDGMRLHGLPFELSQSVLDVVLQMPSIESISIEYTGDVKLESESSSLRVVKVQSVGSLHLDVRHTNVSSIQLVHSNIESIYVPPSVKTFQCKGCAFAYGLPLESMPALYLLNALRVDLRGVTWPETLEVLLLENSQVTTLPSHEGLEAMTCRFCDMAQSLSHLPSTLRYLDLSGTKAPDLVRIGRFPAALRFVKLLGSGLSGDLPPFAQPCLVSAFIAADNDLTRVDLTGCPASEVDVADNPELMHLGELSIWLDSLIISRTKLPQPDHLPAEMSVLVAEDMPHWTKPVYIPEGITDFVVSRPPVGQIIADAVPTFLWRFEAEHCELTEFPFPPAAEQSWWALTTRNRIRLAHNRIRHIDPDVLGPHLLSLDLSHNLLEAIDASTGSDSPRMLLDVSHNRITDAGPSISAQVINLSHNRLTSLPLMPYAHSLDASHNQLVSAVMPVSQHVISSTSALSAMSYEVGRGTLLDLSHNNLTSLRDAVLFERVDVVRVNDNALVEMDLPTVALHELDASHNKLSSLEDVVMRLDEGASVLNVGHNVMHRADTLRDLPATMETLQLDHNKFSGTLPQLSHLPKLASLDLHHSGFGVDAGECDDVTSPECIGPSLTAVEYRTADNEMMACPVFGLAHNPDVLVDMDPVEYATDAVCECIFGFYGVGGECKRCPANAFCSGVYVVPERGFWNHVAVDHRGAPADAQLQQCISYTTTATCSPNTSLATFVKSLDEGTVRDMPRCSPGHTGRMCAACEDGHFEWGDSCNKCPNSVGVFFLLAASFLIVAAAVAYAYKVKPGTSASLKVLVFFTQTIQLARTTGAQMDSRVASVLDLFSGFMIELPGIECVWRSYGLREDTFAAMTMPLWACVIVVVVHTVGASRVRDAAAWWDRNVGALLLLNFMLYLRVASSVLSPLRCETDPFLGRRYFAVSPSDVCDDTVVGVSAMMVAVYVLLVPAVLAIVLFRHRRSLDDDRTSTRFRFLYASYRPRYWYWEGVITLRKLAVLAVMASSARSSVVVPLGVFLVLVLSAVLQDRIEPFAEPRDNAMEYTSLWTLAVLFVLLTASTVPGVRMPLWVGVMVALFQFFFVAGVLIAMLGRHRSVLKRKVAFFGSALAAKLLEEDTAAADASVAMAVRRARRGAVE